MEYTLTNEQKVKATLDIRTATGRPAKVDGAPTWVVTSGAATVQVAEDGLSADIISADDPGLSEIVITADADLGSGVTEIKELITLNTTVAQAANFGLTFGTPEPKDQPEPT